MTCQFRLHLIPLSFLALAVILGPALPACAQTAGPNGEAAQWPQNARSLAPQLDQALRDYEAKMGREKAWANENFALAKLKLEKARLLVHRYSLSDLRDQLVMRDLELGKRIIEALAAGKLPLRPDTGIIEKAYIADNDGSAQPYVVYVPQTLKRGEKVPLFVFLHGYASYLDKVNWVELMFSDELGNLCEESPMIAMLPFGRSNTEFMGVGEVDVLKAIELTKKSFPIDDGRVFISGGSMGGSGAYTITCHYPHLFAGLAPINGRADYYLWQRLDKDKLPPFKRIQTDLDYAAAFPHNLLNVPTFIFHGEVDSLVDVEQSRRFYATLKGLGQPVTYKEFKGEDHWIWGLVFTHPPTKRWLKETRRDLYPKTVKFTTYSLKYNRAYWVEIDEIAQYGEAATVEAKVETGNRLAVTTQNVAKLMLDLAPELVDVNKPLSLTLNGKATEAPLSSGRLSLPILSVPPHGKLRKTPALCGPVRDAYCSRFIIAYGAADRDNAVRLGQEWVDFAAGVATVKPCHEITPQDITECNLILVGTPESNPLIAKIAPELPIKFEDRNYVVGDRKFSRDLASLLMIYPNPLAPSRYVLINSGSLWGSALPRNHKHDLVPDFILFKDTTAPDGSNDFLCAGYFDSSWELSERRTWFAPPK